MLSSQGLQRREDELQAQLDLLNEKIRRLRIRRSIEAGEAIKFQLDQEITEAEEDHRKIEGEFAKLRSDHLYRALLRLNYLAQVLIFRQFIETTQPAAAFLIHGKPDYGQRWLLNRLLAQHLPAGSTSKVLPIDVSRRVRGTDISALWRELSVRVGLPRSASPLEIAEGVHKWCQSQNVILIFHDVDYMYESHLNELMRDFWLPLASSVRDAQPAADNFRLLMFLVDYRGYVDEWNVVFAHQLDEDWEPYVPIRLPIITRFPAQVLVNWINNEVSALPTELIIQADRTVQTILDNSRNGVPEYVLEEICNQCGSNWYEGEDRWLKY